MHALDPKIVPRLRRAEGHLRSVIAMIEAGQDGAAMAQQLHAVEAAIANAKRALVLDHVGHLLEDNAAEKVLPELQRLAKYL